MPYKIILTPAFKHCLKQLEKRYPKIKEDTKTAIHQLIQTPDAGVLIPGGHGARKLRVRNSNIQKGKSGGYRLIYFLADQSDPALYFLLLYAKSDQSDVSIAELKSLLDELDI